MTQEESQHLKLLVDNFHARYKSVNFGEELIKVSEGTSSFIPLRMKILPPPASVHQPDQA
jgi:hypothetical protein